MTDTQAPAEWKNYDDFAAGIATNRLPPSADLIGKSLTIDFEDGRKIGLKFTAANNVEWLENSDKAIEKCEVIGVAAETYFVDTIFSKNAKEAESLVLNLKTGRLLSIRSIVRDAGANPGEPRVAQIFRAGIIAGTVQGNSIVPAPTRDLIGLRAHYDYSPHHVYEHTYLSSTRYAWQCLVGVQRGHGDVDLTTTYKFAEDQYIFTFREFIIPVASTFFYNFADLRSTGKFLGVTGTGAVENNPAGAHIRKVSMSYYLPGQEPV